MKGVHHRCILQGEQYILSWFFCGAMFTKRSVGKHFRIKKYVNPLEGMWDLEEEEN